jgi:hypothetical protein
MQRHLLKYSKTGVRPNVFFRLSVKMLVNIPFISKCHRLVLLDRYLETSSLPFKTDVLPGTENVPAIEILFVCAKKDFEVLKRSIEFAVLATRRHSLRKISLVVPHSDIEETKNMNLPRELNLEIISENTYLDDRQFDLLRNTFGSRSGWVIQQLLKLLHVSNSAAPGVLVCDADTILLGDRLWFDFNQNQILTPTWEYKKSYYQFLHRYGLADVRPKYTFVPHHMLMQPQFLLEARDFMKWDNTDAIISDLTNLDHGGDISPFCIEYELYAQFLFKNHPEKVLLSKWSNIGMSRRDFELKQPNFDDYASVSLHDYL